MTLGFITYDLFPLTVTMGIITHDLFALTVTLGLLPTPASLGLGGSHESCVVERELVSQIASPIFTSMSLLVRA